MSLFWHFNFPMRRQLEDRSRQEAHLPTMQFQEQAWDWPTGQLSCFSAIWSVTFLTTVKKLLCSTISEIRTVNSQMTNSHPFAFRIESLSIYRYWYPKHLGILVRFSPLFQLSLRCFQILLVKGHQKQPKGHFVYSHLELNHTCSPMTSHLNPVFYKNGISKVFSRN